MDADPVGTVEIMARAGVSRQGVEHWRSHGRAGVRFPAPRWTVGGRPAWEWREVEAWIRGTAKRPASL